MIPYPVWSWVVAHRRALAVASGLVLAFVLGWASHRPASRVVYREHDAMQATQTATRDATQTGTVRAATQAEAIAHLATRRRVTVHRVERIAPTGERTITTDRTEETGATLARATQEAATVQAVNVAHAASRSAASLTQVRDVSVLRSAPSPPSWRVAGLVGLSARGPVYGGEVSRRLVGPIWVGAWGLSSVAGGVAVGIEW